MQDVIKVVTKHRRCAMVEVYQHLEGPLVKTVRFKVLAAGEQLPDYFVSHVSCLLVYEQLMHLQ